MGENYNVQKWSKISENNKFDSQQGNYHAVLISDKNSNCSVREFFFIDVDGDMIFLLDIGRGRSEDVLIWMWFFGG